MELIPLTREKPVFVFGYDIHAELDALHVHDAMELGFSEPGSVVRCRLGAERPVLLNCVTTTAPAGASHDALTELTRLACDPADSPLDNAPI